jgi:type II secretory pathway predicted ATPase ExeA
MALRGKGTVIRPETPDEWRQLGAVLRHTFTPHQPIKESEAFNGREELVDKVTDAIAAPGRHAIVYGDRGVGKSSFSNLLNVWLRERGLIPNLTCVRRSCTSAHTFATIWHYLLDEYRWDGKTAKQLLGANPNPYGVFQLLQDLPQNQQYVFIIDEFERLVHKKSKALLTDLIKLLSDDLENVTLVIFGVAKNVSELFQGHASLPRSLQQIAMPHMMDDEVREIVNSRLPLVGMEMTKSCMDAIVMLSQGFPGYVHLLALNAARSAIKRKDVKINRADLTAAFFGVLADVDEDVAFAYKRAVSSQRANQFPEVLAACAFAECDERGRFKTKDIGKAIKDVLVKQIGSTSFQRNLAQLCSSERGPTLHREGSPPNYEYYFDYPLLAPYSALKALADGLVKIDSS